MTTSPDGGSMPDHSERSPRRVDDIDWLAWRPTEIATLMFVRRGDEILLIRKKRGLGAGKINGPGGRIEGTESALECAVRETQEELHVTPVDARLRGRQRFHFTDGYKLTVFVFLAHHHTGEARETDEAVPLWTPVDHIPYSQMWQDDELWIPMMLRGEVFDGRYIFDGDSMLSYAFRERPQLAAIAADDPAI